MQESRRALISQPVLSFEFYHHSWPKDIHPLVVLQGVAEVLQVHQEDAERTEGRKHWSTIGDRIAPSMKLQRVRRMIPVVETVGVPDIS